MKKLTIIEPISNPAVTTSLERKGSYGSISTDLEGNKIVAAE